MYYLCDREIKTAAVIFKRKEGKEKEKEREGRRKEGESEDEGGEQEDAWDTPAITLLGPGG